MSSQSTRHTHLTDCLSIQRLAVKRGPSYIRSFVDVMKKQLGINVFLAASWEKGDGSITTGMYVYFG